MGLASRRMSPEVVVLGGSRSATHEQCGPCWSLVRGNSIQIKCWNDKDIELSGGLQPKMLACETRRHRVSCRK